MFSSTLEIYQSMLLSYRLVVLNICFWCLLLFVGPSCTKVKPEKPDGSAPASGSLENKLSTIELPIIYEIDRLQKLINQKISGTLYLDNSYEDNDNDRLKLEVKKAGSIYVTVIKNQLYYTVPLDIAVDYSKKLLPKLKTSFALQLRFMSLIDIDSNWQLKTRSQYLGINWIREPELKVAFAKVNLHKQVELLLENKASEISSKIDDVAHNELDITKDIGKVWGDLQKPILINKKEEMVWLLMKPNGVEATKIHGDRENVLIQLRVSSFVETFLGKDPVYAPNLQLPPLRKAKDAGEPFNINILAKFPFEKLNAVLNRNMKGKVFEVEGKKVRLKGAEILGGEGQLILKVEIGGVAKGDIYFKGTPAYDGSTQTLWLKDFDFDVKTEEYLLGAANWLLHDEIKERMRRELHFSLKEQIDLLPQIIENGIANARVGQKINVTFQGLSVGIDQLLVTTQDLQLLLNATGNVELKLKDLGEKPVENPL